MVGEKNLPGGWLLVWCSLGYMLATFCQPLQRRLYCGGHSCVRVHVVTCLYKGQSLQQGLQFQSVLLSAAFLQSFSQHGAGQLLSPFSRDLHQVA